MEDNLPRHTRTVTLGELVERVVTGAHSELHALAHNLPGQPEAERKRELARFLHNLRQRLVRLALVAEWAPVQKRAMISVLCGDMLGQLRQHERAFTDSADRLFSLHGQMEWARAPLFDLPGALDVLCNGRYSCLPAAIADVAPRLAPGVVGGLVAAEAGGGGAGGGARDGGGGGSVGEHVAVEDAKAAAEREDHARRVEREIRGRLLEVEAGVAAGGARPVAMRVWEITKGTAVVGVHGEYRAVLTLGGPPPLLPPPPPSSGDEAPVPPPQPPPPAPYGGWFVERIEMLAGERTVAAAGGTAESVRRFSLTRLEHRVLGERATARMAGMSPPPPAPPELIEGGAQGLAGLHYVCHGAALRLAAAAVMAQSKRVARAGGAWHGGAIRTENIKAGAGSAAGARARGGSGARGEVGGGIGIGVGAPQKKGSGEGIRMWFWLPGGRGEVGPAGSRLAGVDVGSVEAVRASAAAIDAAVTAGTLPRVELTYVQPDENDSASGSIQAAALIPDDLGGGGGGGEGGDGGGGVSVEVTSVSLPFNTAAVDIREVLADGIRAASRIRLARVLAEITAPCQAMGLAPSLEPAVVNPGMGAGASAAGSESSTGGAEGAGLAAVEDRSGGSGGAGASGFEGVGEDGWGASPRPAIVVQLTTLGTAVQVTCGKRDGDLSLCGIGALLPSAAAATLENAVRIGGAATLPKVLVSLRRAALEHDLRAAVRALGHHPHPAPHTLRCNRGWPFGGAPPAVLIPVAPSAGGCYVAVFVGGGNGGQGGGGEGGGGGGKGDISKASLALLHTQRVNAAARAEVLSWAPLTGEGGVLGSRKRKAGEAGVAAGLVAECVARGMVAAVEAETITAQRLAVADWLNARGLHFQDARPIPSGGGGEAGHILPHPAIVFSARLGEGEWGAEEAATVEIHFRGKDGICAVVRSPWSPQESIEGDDATAAATAAGPPAAAASCGGAASVSVCGQGGGCTVTLDYPGTGVSGGVEFGPGAACADVHRAVALLAFLRRVEPALRSGVLRMVAIEPLSAVLRAGGGIDSRAEGGGVSGGGVEAGTVGGGGSGLVRVAWVGAAGAEGGLAAWGVEVPGTPPFTAKQEAALSEAARICNVEAFCDSFRQEQ